MYETATNVEVLVIACKLTSGSCETAVDDAMLGDSGSK